MIFLLGHQRGCARAIDFTPFGSARRRIGRLRRIQSLLSRLTSEERCDGRVPAAAKRLPVRKGDGSPRPLTRG